MQEYWKYRSMSWINYLLEVCFRLIHAAILAFQDICLYLGFWALVDSEILIHPHQIGQRNFSNLFLRCLVFFFFISTYKLGQYLEVGLFRIDMNTPETLKCVKNTKILVSLLAHIVSSFNSFCSESSLFPSSLISQEHILAFCFVVLKSLANVFLRPGLKRESCWESCRML